MAEGWRAGAGFCVAGTTRRGRETTKYVVSTSSPRRFESPGSWQSFAVVGKGRSGRRREGGRAGGLIDGDLPDFWLKLLAKFSHFSHATDDRLSWSLLRRQVVV